MNRHTMLIEADELRTKLDNPNVRIYDATILFFRKESESTTYEQYQQGHIPGAAFFDHGRFSDAGQNYQYMVLPEAALAAQIGQIGISADSEVIFYANDLLPCATRAWWVLRYAGHNNVRVLNGGLTAWQQAGGQIETGDHRYAPTRFTGRLRSEMFVGKDEVLTAMEDGRTCTVNTLTAEIYQKAHIKGSALLPCSDLMQEMRTFVSTAEIAARLEEEAQYERVIAYCGGGIAATVNGMAHLMAGNKNVTVYDGSMNEWTGEKLPLTIGETA